MPNSSPAVLARQKLGELRVLADALDGREGAEGPLAQQRARPESRRQSARVHRPEVARRLATLSEADSRRASSYAQRRVLQEQAFGLLVYPTTTIGSFPQTQQVRQARAQHKAGKLSDADYETFLEAETERCVRFQERIGLTCWCMASTSATTWSSTLASSWTASPSPSWAGCRATAAVASSRRSSSATWCARSR